MAQSTTVKRHWLVAYTLLLGVVLVSIFISSSPADAATGINQQLNFQGRLLNSQGATVPDGYYNIEFKIYQDGDGTSAGDTTGTPAGSLLWTEDHINANSQAIVVQNGYFSVQLGAICAFSGGSCQGNTNAGVNWNSDTLWLSMNVGGTNATCTPFSACTPDGEMLPMKRLSSNPYALNSGLLGGLSSSQFIQLARGVQTDTTSATSIFLNKTGAGNIVDLQSAGSDAFIVNNSGDLTFGSNTNHTLSVASAAASTAGANLTVAAGAAGSGTTALAGGTLTVQAGAGGGTNGNGGNLVIDAGVANGTGTNGTINIGTNYASAVTIGSGSKSGPITVQSSGIIQTINGSSTSPSDTIKTTTNSTAAFQVQNSSGNNTFSVDTSNNQTVLGQSNATNGSLTFKNSSSANGITINSTAANSSYTLTLPSATPATGLCIETSSGNASQLVFASCTNNNASIQETHEWDANNVNTLGVSPSNVGDEVVLTTQIPTSGVTVSGITGGGVTTWNKVVANNGNGTVNRVEMWVGTVTSTGSSTITVNYSAAPGAEEITATEFTAAGANASTSWGVESSSSLLDSTASTTVDYPNATAVNGSELYVGYAQVQNPPATAGTTTGFNYLVTSTQHNVITYNTDLAANTSYQPTANQNSSGEANTVEAVLTAFVTSTSINNATSLQKANFYVQAASNGSVAGILEAAGSGTADIMDLRNSSGTNVVNFGGTGSTTFENSANSTNAFQVQNSAGVSVLSVNTAANQVSLGTATSTGGVLSFNDSSDSNAISLTAPTSIAASYSLALPTNTPTAGLCLGTSPSNANQLIFASCATQVSAAGISYVNSWSSSGSAVTTVADSPSNKGNLLVLYSHAANAVNITSISGGGVSSWTKTTAYSGGGTPGNIEMWRGVVSTTGAGTITVTYSATPGTNEIAAQEYTMGSSNGTWAIDTSGTATSTSSVTTINYPSLTAQNSSELYTGYAYGQYTMSAGTSTGFTYLATSAGKYMAYDTSVTGGLAYQPTATQSTAGTYASIGALIEAYSGTSVIVSSTATQEANFNVQASTAGTVAGVLQAASSGSADILDARDGNGNNILAVNATGTTLGTPNVVGGSLTFAASGNSNTISLGMPTTPGSSYTLTLPTTTPVAGQCLATSPNSSSQLVFSSCANQVTSVAINYVNSWSTSGNAITTLNVAPASVGDLMTLFSSPNSSSTIASVSGGGVSSWTKVTGNATGSGAGTSSIEMWRGEVTSAGASTITVTFNKSPGNPNQLAAMEFSTGTTNGSWVVDASNAQYNSTSSTTIAYPSLTPQSSKDLYVGYASGSSAISAGSTTGFTYLPGSTSSNQGAYNTSVSTNVQPTSTQATAGTSITVGALIAAYSSSSVISNSTVTQEANFNIQAATNGSVAGVLQAASGGNADVLDIMNSAGAVTDSFGYTGNLLIKPSPGSVAALQVQTTGGANVLSADTTNLRVVIGAGSSGETTPSLLVLDNETGTSADPTELNGALYYNATTHDFRCGVDGVWQSCSGMLYANTSLSGTISGCSNTCSAFSTAAPVPANYCQTGRVIKLLASGYYSSIATASNIQFGVYYGNSSTSASSDTLIGTLSPAESVTSANNNFFQMNFNVICFSTSSMQAEGTLSLQTGAANTGMAELPMNSPSSTTVATNTASNLYVFPIWDTANAGNSATLTQFTVTGY